eukprot:2150704-Prymnesium_polylepis.1
MCTRTSRDGWRTCADVAHPHTRGAHGHGYGHGHGAPGAARALRSAQRVRRYVKGGGSRVCAVARNERHGAARAARSGTAHPSRDALSVGAKRAVRRGLRSASDGAAMNGATGAASSEPCHHVIRGAERGTRAVRAGGSERARGQ